MAYSHFDKFKAFFLALNRSNYHPERMDPKIITPQDKAYCFGWLLEKIPELKGKSNSDLIEFLRDPKKVRERILGKFVQGERTELTKTLEEKPAAGEEVTGQPAGAATTPATQETPPPTGSSGGGIPGMGMPSGPVISAPRFIHNVPHAPEAPKSDLVIANKGGVVAEAPPTQFHVTDSAGNIQATYSKEPLPATAQSKLVVPGTEKGDISKLVTTGSGPGDASKLVSARSDGSIIADSRGNITKEHTIPTGKQFNPSAFKFRLSNLKQGAQKLISSAGPGFKLNSGRVMRGLGSIVGNVGSSLAHTGLPGAYNALSKTGMRGANFIGNTGGRISRLKNSVRRPSWASPKGAMGKRIAIIIFLGLFGTTFLTGFTGSSGTDSIPIPGSSSINPSDISQCQFTRGDHSPKEANFKSPLLLSYIQEASGLTKIPAAVLAAFIRVESPSAVNFTDEQIKSYQCIETEPGKNVSDTGALGIMQLQPEGTKGNDSTALATGAKLIGKEYSQLTKADYCDVRKSIIMGAGFILMKMSYKNMETSPPLLKGIYPVYGDGTQWSPSWTNDNQAISKLVNGYYGCLQYPSCSSGPYNYATDVSTSIQSCQVASSGAIPPPPTDGNYKKWLQDFGVNINDGFVPNVYKWAYEVLASTANTAPKFKERLGTTLIEVRPTCDISNTSGRVIYFRNQIQFCPGKTNDGPTTKEDTFKQVFIHELGHVINGSYRPGTYGDRIKDAIKQDGGYLTKYSASAATANDEICGAGNEDTRADEDFAESVSYFVNGINVWEQDYGCGKALNQNPIYAQAGGRLLYPKHYQLMVDLLK